MHSPDVPHGHDGPSRADQPNQALIVDDQAAQQDLAESREGREVTGQVCGQRVT